MNDLSPNEEYEIVHEPPAIWPTLEARFGVKWDATVVTVGSKIHTKHELSSDLIVHERTHVRQQSLYPGGHEAWWQKYLSDDAFRLSQEIEAYRNQYAFLRSNTKDRNGLARRTHKIASDLSGPMYGNIISFEAAKLQIKS